MNHYKKHIAVLLLAISALFVVPKELVHELTFHTDTIHEQHDDHSGLVIELPHHHCASLVCFFPPFNADCNSFEVIEINNITEHNCFNDYNISFQHPDAFANKGPPISRLV